MVETLQQTLARLNALLAEGEITPYRLGIAAPGDLKPAPKNAHFMTQDMTLLKKGRGEVK